MKREYKENMIRHLTLEELGKSLEDGDILIGDVIVVVDALDPKEYIPEAVNELKPAMA